MIATPSGSVTVVSLSDDSARPLGLNAEVCGTWTFTVSPEDVLASLLSGATLISGGNLSFEQPVSETGVPAELCVTVLAFAQWPGSSHESAAIVERRGPWQPVGIVRKALLAAGSFSNSPPPVPSTSSQVFVIVLTAPPLHLHAGGNNTGDRRLLLMTGASPGAAVTVACTG